MSIEERLEAAMAASLDGLVVSERQVSTEAARSRGDHHADRIKPPIGDEPIGGLVVVRPLTRCGDRW